jgi:hypothetical protein
MHAYRPSQHFTKEKYSQHFTKKNTTLVDTCTQQAESYFVGQAFRDGVIGIIIYLLELTTRYA